MKKIISLFLISLLIVVTLAGCGSKKSAGVKVIDIQLTQEEYALRVKLS